MMHGVGGTDSVHILEFIKAGSIGAEIGVWKGFTSEKFLKRNPEKLYLIDPWAVEAYKPSLNVDDDTFNYNKYINRYKSIVGSSDPAMFQKHYDKVHDNVVKKFKNNENVEVCRMLSTEWFAAYDGPKLDWIYIDGDHSYTGVINDLNASLAVVKPGGVIIGDDYKWHNDGDKGGVKKAVKEFIETNNLTVKQYGKIQFVIQL